jgi:hypothetical protein
MPTDFGPFKVVASKWNRTSQSYEAVPGIVKLEVDIDALVRLLGSRAIVSKGGVAVEAGGAIKMTRVKS